MTIALKQILKDYQNVEIIQGDVQRHALFATPFFQKGCGKKGVPLTPTYKVVANIPYYLTSPVIRMFLESDKPPREMILMIQKEVAQRICVKPPKMNLLAVSVQFYAQPKIISYVSKKSFWPQPKVDSAIIRISNIQKPRGIDIEKFFQIVKAGFSSPRKQLANNLAQKLNLPRQQIERALTQCGLNPRVRAQDLRIEDWIKLSKMI